MKDTSKPIEIEDQFVTVSDVRDSMLDQFRNGKQPGSKTYVDSIDQVSINGYKTKAWSWRRGEFNIWTGYNNEGKTQKLNFLMLLKVINENKKFAIFSPENFPPDEFFDDIVHTLLGKTTDKNMPHFDMSEKEYLGALERIKDNFFFVYPKDQEGRPNFEIEEIERAFEYLIWEYDVFGVVVDPYIKIRHRIEPGEAEHLYASRFTMDRVNFTRKNNVSYNLVMHQVTPVKGQDGNYPKPNLYKIKGGGTFADSVDNVISIWRPNRGTNPLDTKVKFTSEKIKKQKIVGVPYEVDLDFDRKKNRYIDGLTGKDFIDGKVKELSVNEIYNPNKFTSSSNDFEEPPF